MKFWVTIEGRSAEVEFRTERNRLVVELEGRRLEADFHALPDGEVYSLLIGGQSHEVRVAPGEAGQLDMTLNGSRLAVEVRHPLEKLLQTVGHAGGADGGETLVAPMPGLVVAIRVKPGDVVEPGQAVIVVEAMKMQNELPSRHGGVVQEVFVQERATVSAGQKLLRLGPRPA